MPRLRQTDLRARNTPCRAVPSGKRRCRDALAAPGSDDQRLQRVGWRRHHLGVNLIEDRLEIVSLLQRAMRGIGLHFRILQLLAEHAQRAVRLTQRLTLGHIILRDADRIDAVHHRAQTSVHRLAHLLRVTVDHRVVRDKRPKLFFLIGGQRRQTFTATHRRILQEVDLIAAEDTRNSIKLLNHFEIHTPMTSYHEYNKYDKGRELVQKLLAGTNIALITDAGTPGISDPGEELVKMAYEAGIEVTSLPGACACVTALTLSGLSTRRFVFEAFLPPDKKEHKLALERLKNETRTMIVYEAPHHLLKTLRELLETLGNRRLTICRELTKKHETAWQTTMEDAITRYEQEDPKGECVLVIEGRSQKEIEDEAKAAFEEISIEEHMKRYEDQGITRKEAMKLVAKDRGVTKRDIYQYLLGKE